MRRIVLVLCCVGVVAGLAVSSAFASAPAGVRLVGCALDGGRATVAAGTDVVLVIGEVTKTYGLAVAWPHDLLETSADGDGPPAVDGVPISAPHQYWNAPVPSDPTGWVTWWVYDTGISLAAGQTMTVDLNLLIEHPLPDGFPQDGRPSGLQLPATGCTITGV